MRDAHDAEVIATARRLAELGSDTTSRVFKMSWWSDRLIAWAMSDESFKTQLFRLVDVYPALSSDDDVARHLAEYLAVGSAPRLLDFGMSAADHVPGGHRIEASVARRNIERMARQFIVGETPAEAVEGLGQLWRDGSASTVDLLGEKTVVASQADAYAAKVMDLLEAMASGSRHWPPDPHLEADDRGALGRVNISVKPTALAVHYEPLTGAHGLDDAVVRLDPILERAGQVGAHVHLDMEHGDVKDLTLDLLERLATDPRHHHTSLGIVVQAYLRSAGDDLARVIEISRGRPTPVTVRLVKGAYWDTETVLAAQRGWRAPTWVHKGDSDLAYERLTTTLHEHHDVVRAAFGSHNLRSVAHAIVEAKRLGIPDHGYEIQMLAGMAEPTHLAVKRLGHRLRVYAPVGDLVPGMAYLVRRLLENTSNESFVRHRYAEGEALDALIAAPVASDEIDAVTGGPTEPPPPVLGDGRDTTDADDPTPHRREPLAEWRRGEVRRHQAAAVETMRSRMGHDVPVVIDGERIRTPRTLDSVDPAEVATVVAHSHLAGPDEVAGAVEVAMARRRLWADTPVTDRAAVLFRAAAWMRQRRADIAALEMFEAAKPWDEADADVCEAIDFLEYYGREALRLARGGPLHSPPGETNHLRYDPLGVTVVIAPWNFPLAIATGMTVAALVAGNPVVLKPAEQTPATAAVLVDALEAAGLPDGVLGFLPGVGEEIGPLLVDHPEVAMVAFTGSRAVGLELRQRVAHQHPAQRHLKRLITELGGKNALVVDHDADLDQVVPAAVHSAFGFAGQKCSAASRLVVHRRLHDECLARLAEATAQLIVGHPAEAATQVPPLIDADAQRRVRAAIDAETRRGTVVATHHHVPDTGWFVAPTVVADVDVDDPIACDELFGPVLTVLAADSFDDAIAIANRTDYALTAGVFSRSPDHIAVAADRLRAGNVYINRGITGAVVGEQAFGGYGMSGEGTKAGGPDYLARFMVARTITENTLRQGFAPPSGDGVDL